MLGAKERGICSSLRSLSHPLLMAALLLWPLILIYRNGLVISLPAFAGYYWTTLSLTSIEAWFLRALPHAFPVLNLLIATLVILREQL